MSPRFILRYYKKGETNLPFSTDTEIEVVGAITLGVQTIDITSHLQAAQFLEDCIDHEVYSRIKQDYPNYYITPRFSPGYGSLPASDNKRFIALSGCNFISALPSGALFPTYSVVFAVGLSKKKQPDHTKCELCNSKNCPFRRNEAISTSS